MYFDLELWRMTKGLRGRIVLAVLLGLFALVAGIARFYEGFGAQEEFFYNYHTTIISKLSQRFG